MSGVPSYVGALLERRIQTQPVSDALGDWPRRLAVERRVLLVAGDEATLTFVDAEGRVWSLDTDRVAQALEEVTDEEGRHRALVAGWQWYPELCAFLDRASQLTSPVPSPTSVRGTLLGELLDASAALPARGPTASGTVVLRLSRDGALALDWSHAAGRLCAEASWRLAALGIDDVAVHVRAARVAVAEGDVAALERTLLHSRARLHIDRMALQLAAD